MKRHLLGGAALVAAGSLISLSAAPGYAATTVSQASATALRVAIAGNGSDSGTVTATNDGSGETKTGDSQPPVAVLDPQGLLNVGTLAQDAAARVQGGDGVSQACSGVAGNGGAVASVGESSCISPGDPVGVNIANLDLSKTIVIDPASAFGELSDPVQQIVTPILDLTPQIAQALAPLGDLDIGGSFGAVEARCQARPRTATGNAIITDAKLSLTLPGQDPIILANLPVHPAPNTKVITDLDKVVAEILKAIGTDLKTSLTGALGPVADALGLVDQDPDSVAGVLTQQILAQIAPQLEPLEQLLDITLNKQTGRGTDRISVTAIDLQVAKAAAEQLGASLVSAEIANVTCGPTGRVDALRVPPEEPKVPKVIDAGAEASTPEPSAEESWTGIAAALLAATGLVSLVGYRRRLLGR